MGDYIVRATAANYQIRAFAATTRDLVIIPARWLQRLWAVCLQREL